LPVEVKAEFVTRLVDAGHTLIETTSFVPAKRIAQLADAEELLDAIKPAPGVHYPVLVPNERGLAGEATRISNRIRGPLTGIRPALEHGYLMRTLSPGP
jgi:hypothetical protein